MNDEAIDIILKVAGWIVSPVLAFIIGQLTSKLKKARDEKDAAIKEQEADNWAVKEACKYMLKKSLQDDYEYYTSLGYCPIEEKNEIEAMHKIYAELKGNGPGTRYYNGIMGLPDTPPHPTSNSEEV